MRRPILRTGVGLDLDDPALATSRAVLADKASAEQDAGDLRRDAAEKRPVQDAQAGVPG
jgi:hypothetical protein